MWDAIFPYLAALLPTIGLLGIFYVVFKTIFEADRRERRAQAQWERQQDQLGASDVSQDRGGDPTGD